MGQLMIPKTKIDNWSDLGRSIYNPLLRGQNLPKELDDGCSGEQPTTTEESSWAVKIQTKYRHSLECSIQYTQIVDTKMSRK